MGELVAYGRVSTKEQNLALQLQAFAAAGVHPDRIHTDEISGASMRRPGLELAIKDLREGDTLVVWRIDRLARSMRQLYHRLDQVYAAGASFKSLQENFDFGTVSGKLVLGVLGLVAEFERQIIAQRTSAGIAALKERQNGKGWKWGPDVIMTPAKIKEAGRLLNEKKMSGPQVAKKLNVSTASIYAFWKHDGYKKFVRKYPKPKHAKKQTN